jgi:UDP-glucose 4-epimerase
LALNYILKRNTSASFNLENNEGFSVLEIIRTFERIANLKVNFEVTDRRPGDPARLVASNSKAKQLLNWKPQLTIGQILISAWEWEKHEKY